LTSLQQFAISESVMKYLELRPAQASGQPTTKGTRIRVAQVITMLAWATIVGGAVWYYYSAFWCFRIPSSNFPYEPGQAVSGTFPSSPLCATFPLYLPASLAAVVTLMSYLLSCITIYVVQRVRKFPAQRGTRDSASQELGQSG
jgi:hypothetical protein